MFARLGFEWTHLPTWTGQINKYKRLKGKHSEINTETKSTKNVLHQHVKAKHLLLRYQFVLFFGKQQKHKIEYIGILSLYVNFLSQESIFD